MKKKRKGSNMYVHDCTSSEYNNSTIEALLVNVCLENLTNLLVCVARLRK